MRTISFILILCFSLLKLQAQENYITRNGQISFFSSTPLEDIKAMNNEVASVINRKTGSVQFIVLIKSFQFRKAPEEPSGAEELHLAALKHEISQTDELSAVLALVAHQHTMQGELHHLQFVKCQ